jgi:hypothetical protein
LSSITSVASDVFQGADDAVHNPIVQTVVTIGSCTLGGAVGCTVATAGFAAVNAYSDYNSDGGFTSSFFIDTGLNIAASSVDLTSLKGLIGSTENLEDSLGNATLSSQISKLSQIPLPNALRIIFKNILIGGGVAALNFFIQSELVNPPMAGASERGCTQ